MAATAYIALGSNLGDRCDTLDRALEVLQERPGIEITQVSSFLETEPVGGPPGQGRFLNAAAELHTELAAPVLLQTLLDVERALGRVRQERFGPRTIDLDLLLYDTLVCSTPELTLPHARMHERRFVLQPLAEIAPQAVHPVLGRTIAQLLGQLGSLAPAPLPPRRELTGLRAVVTGSTSGIGQAIALMLASAGADVLVHGRRSIAAAETVAAGVRERGGRSMPVLADLRDERECRRLVGAAWDEWRGIDIWVNNAGADTLTGEAGRWPFERKLQELLAVDVKATVMLSRDVGHRMKAAGRGVILNMGWDQAETGMEGDSGQLFGTIKGAVMAFTRSLALALAPEVRVNCLAPGWVRTAWGQGASERWQERVRQETPLGRWGTPEDVATAARWLASPAAGFITGQVIRVNGGGVR
jgi:2-amino-4-hydroxy-6-hydroxymethyldihydropteridine diphosphokinase